MNRSRWSKPTPSSPAKEAPLRHHRYAHTTARRASLEELNAERRLFIFQQAEGAAQERNVLITRLTGLLVVAGLLLVGLLLAWNSFQPLWSAASAGLRLAFALSFTLAALLLLVAAGITLGACAAWGGSGAGITPVNSADPTAALRAMTREDLLEKTLARLHQLQRSLQRLSWAFRIAAGLILLALFPILLVGVILVV